MSKQDLTKHKKGEVIREAKVDGDSSDFGKKLVLIIILLLTGIFLCIKLFS